METNNKNGEGRLFSAKRPRIKKDPASDILKSEGMEQGEVQEKMRETNEVAKETFKSFKKDCL